MQVKIKYVILFFAAVILSGSYACKKPSPVAITPAPSVVTDTTTLKGVAAFKIGAAIDVYRLQTDQIGRAHV